MKTFGLLISGVLLSIMLSGCQSTGQSKANEAALQQAEAAARLERVLASQTAEVKARYGARNPKETLEFFGIEPGMTVVEVLPGSGWYSQILVPYVGKEGSVIGVDYALSMWPLFFFGTPEFIEERKQWPGKWEADATAWTLDGLGANAQALSFEQVPNTLDGTVDAVLYVRALHNLARFEGKGQYLTHALQRTFALLKSGGVVGIVQHEAAETRADAWADGSRGYLKTSFVKRVMQEAGFEFVAASAVNANPKDRPGEDDNVWRLPPSFYTTKNKPEAQAPYVQIGESNRATLLFKKP